MANPLFDLVKAAAKSATGTTFGKVTTTAFVIGVGTVSVKVYQDSRTGNVVGAERVETTVAKNDAQGDVRLKMEGLKDAPKDAEAEKAAEEAAARAAEEAAKAKEEEAKKLEEALKEQREAEEAAALAEQQAQGEENFADEEQNSDDLKDENADEGNGEGDVEAEADENEKGPDSFRGGDGDEKVDESGNPINETVDKKGGDETGEVDENGNPINETVDKKGGDETGEVDENGNLIDETVDKKGGDETGEVDKNDGNGNDENADDKNKVTPENANERQQNETNQQQEQGAEPKGESEDGAPSGETGTNDGFHDNNFGLNNSSNVLSWRDARAEWETKFRNALKDSDGVVWMTVEDLVGVGHSLRTDESAIESGLAWAIKAAADGSKGSTVTRLSFEGLGTSDDICRGVGFGINDILWAHVHSPSFNLSSNHFCIEAWSWKTEGYEWAARRAMDCTSAAEAREDSKVVYGVSSDTGAFYIYRRQRNDERSKAEDAKRAKEELLLKRFRGEEVVCLSAGDLGIDMQGGNWDGWGNASESSITWAIVHAATEPDSIVRRVLFALPVGEKEQAGMAQRIAFGVNELLQNDLSSVKDGQLKYGFFEVGYNSTLAPKAWFGRDGSFGASLSWRGDNSDRFKLAIDPHWILLFSQDCEKHLGDTLRTRFEKGIGYVRPCELDAYDALKGEDGGANWTRGNGVMEILWLAAHPDSKVKQLGLMGDDGSLGEFRALESARVLDALKSVLAPEEINERLTILTDWRGERGIEAEYAFNFPEVGTAPKRFISIDEQTGVVSIVNNKLKALQYADARNVWNNEIKNEVLTHFKNKGGDISYNDLFVGDYSVVASTYCSTYVEPFVMQPNVIPLAADPESKVRTLDLRGHGIVPGRVWLAVREVLKQDGKIHGFDLKVDNPGFVMKYVGKQNDRARARIRLEGDVLRFTDETGSAATTVECAEAPAKAPGTGAATAVDEAKLEALEKEFGKEAAREFKFLNPVQDYGFYYGMPCIYAYSYFNDTKREDLRGDGCVIDEVFEPTAAGFGEKDLVLKATCYYKKGLYADAGEQNTRNYFAHPWLKRLAHAKEGEEVVVKAAILRPDGITPVRDFGASGAPVSYHAPKENSVALSGNKFVFRIEKSDASAWFISEFDPTDPVCNPNKLSFPNVDGKRRIAIHWTFVEDDDAHRFNEAIRKAKAGGTENILPCQFSPNENERDTKPLLDFLQKEKEEEVFSALEQSIKKGEQFPLREVSAFLLEDVLEKAQELKGGRFTLTDMGSDGHKQAFDVLEGAFRNYFGSRRDEVPTWDIVGTLNDDAIWLYADAFRRKMNRWFGSEGINLFVNLDQQNGTIWVDDKKAADDNRVAAGECPELQLEADGTLKWTDELKAWWSNPANTVEAFAAALSELPKLKAVDFGGLLDGEDRAAAEAFGDLSASDEWKAFEEDAVLHRYWQDEKSIKALVMCSGVNFGLCNGGNPKANKSICEFVDGFDCTAVDWDKSVWSVKVKEDGGCFAVEDNGKNRLLWNGCARDLLHAATAVPGAFKDFADEIKDAETIAGAKINCIDFSFGDGDPDFLDLRDACKYKELWEALGEKFNGRGDVVCICPAAVMKESVDGKSLARFLRSKGWAVTYGGIRNDARAIVTINGGGAGGGAGDEDEDDMGLDAFFNSAAHAGAPAGVPAGLTAGEVFFKESGGDFAGFWMPRHMDDTRVRELLLSLKTGNTRLEEFIGFVKEAKIDKLVLPLDCPPGAMRSKVIAVFSNCPALREMEVYGNTGTVLGLSASYEGNVEGYTLISRRAVRLQKQGGGGNVVTLSEADGDKTKNAFSDGCITCGDYIDAYKAFVNFGEVDKGKPIYINLAGGRREKKNFFSGCSLSDFIRELLTVDVDATGQWSVCVPGDFFDDISSGVFASLPVDVQYYLKNNTLPESKENINYIVLKRR